VRAQWQTDLIFEGYPQEDWVTAQRYQSAPWAELLDLWQAYNLHLARVMAAVPSEIRLAPHTRHNLDVVAFVRPSADQPVTLDYFMDDYVAHLKHHLRQIEALGVTDQLLTG
jgi:hypothetical protein